MRLLITVQTEEEYPSPRIFPLFVSLNPSVLFALKTTSAAFVDPRKSFTPTVLPERDQSALILADAQRALPDESEVRTYPFDAPERILRPWNVPVPATSSFEVAASTPIPTFVPENITPPVQTNGAMTRSFVVV